MSHQCLGKEEGDGLYLLEVDYLKYGDCQIQAVKDKRESRTEVRSLHPVGQIWLSTRYVNKILWQQRRDHSFMHCLWVLSCYNGRAEKSRQRIYDSQSWKDLLSGLYRKKKKICGAWSRFAIYHIGKYLKIRNPVFSMVRSRISNHASHGASLPFNHPQQIFLTS